MSDDTLTVIHTVGSLVLTHGGPSRTVPAMCGALQRASDVIFAPIVTCGVEQALTALGTKPPEILLVSLRNLDGFLSDRIAAWRPRGPVLLHDHGQWHAINRSSARMARRYHNLRIVSPRGMLSPWSLTHKRWKKWLAWHLFAKRDLTNAHLIHATSDLEADELRALGVRQPIAVIPNGVDDFEKPSPKRPLDRPYVLFLSRIHHKKGILELLKVWEHLPTNGFELILAGNDEQGLLANRELPPHCRYVGPVEGTTKAQWMRHASLFVLPTYSENFGVVVAESLMAGVPVITTHGTPWQSLEREKAGWWIETGEGPLYACMKNALTIPADELKRMGQNGRNFVERAFNWDAIGANMLASYRWLVEGGTPPCVIRCASNSIEGIHRAEFHDLHA